ncbi:hypothetical protein ABT025_18680 [Streptomyces sp. NPDC002809]|uniref:hypothetical protein n=1 Tax=Streptomyces sp. NPDC002809 TaxID=3154433 RepID=UPI0033278C4D
MTDDEMIHHLLTRSFDGVILHGEQDHLRALIRQMQAERDTLRAVCESNKRAYKGAIQAAWTAEAAIERVRAWIAGEPVTARSEFGNGYREALSDITTALDEQQTTTTEAAPFGDRHGPTPDEVRAGLFTTIGPPVSCPHCGPDAAPIPSTHWTKHLIRHHPERPTA